MTLRLLIFFFVTGAGKVSGQTEFDSLLFHALPNNKLVWCPELYIIADSLADDYLLAFPEEPEFDTVAITESLNKWPYYSYVLICRKKQMNEVKWLDQLVKSLRRKKQSAFINSCQFISLVAKKSSINITNRTGKSTTYYTYVTIIAGY